MGWFSRDRVQDATPRPAEPLVPSVEVKRIGLIRYRVKLKLVEGETFRDWFTKYTYSEGSWGYNGLKFVRWIKWGEPRAEEFAKRKLEAYMRQISYRSGEAKRFVGKLPE